MEKLNLLNPAGHFAVIQDKINEIIAAISTESKEAAPKKEDPKKGKA